MSRAGAGVPGEGVSRGAAGGGGWRGAAGGEGWSWGGRRRTIRSWRLTVGSSRVLVCLHSCHEPRGPPLARGIPLCKTWENYRRITVLSAVNKQRMNALASELSFL